MIDYGWLLFSVLLASLLGFELIAKVPSKLHTPLMSGTNAISGITLIGALEALSQVDGPFLEAVAYISIFFATINIVGGYWVTDRMLKMFHTKGTSQK